jgi:predicted transcriptional regulator of viral defense system
MRRSRCSPLEHMRMLVLKAKGNIVTLKPKALCDEGRAAAALLRRLADAGYLKRLGDGKYLLRRGTPLWEALERGEADRLLGPLRVSRRPRRRGKR